MQKNDVFLDDIVLQKSWYKRPVVIIIILVTSLVVISLTATIIVLSSSSSEIPKEPELPKRYVPKNETLLLDLWEMITTVSLKNVTGEGKLKWKDLKDLKKNGLLSGDLKIPFIDDEIYTSMKLPSEGKTFMTSRINPSLMSNQEDGYVKAVSIGAVYQVL